MPSSPTTRMHSSTHQLSRKNFQRRLGRDECTVHAAFEPPNAGLLSKAPCSTCKILHPRSSFTVAGALKRIGQCERVEATKNFRFCEHSFSDSETLHKLTFTQTGAVSSDLACCDRCIRWGPGISLKPWISRADNGEIHNFRMIYDKSFYLDKLRQMGFQTLAKRMSAAIVWSPQCAQRFFPSF